MEVTLKKASPDNFEEILDLELVEEQRNYLSSNVYSIAQSKIYPSCIPLAIYLKNKVVGFLMYTTNVEEGKPEDCHIIRFMVDYHYQNQGIGRQALELVISMIRENENIERIMTCYWPRNTVAKNLYARLGFIEIGIDENKEMIAELKKQPNDSGQ